jgi:hypothetical protein
VNRSDLYFGLSYLEIWYNEHQLILTLVKHFPINKTRNHLKRQLRLVHGHQVAGLRHFHKREILITFLLSITLANFIRTIETLFALPHNRISPILLANPIAHKVIFSCINEHLNAMIQ